jgi:hypothetical protein
MFGYNLLMMSPFLEDAETKYRVGFSGILAMSVNLFVNFIYVVLALFTDLRDLAKKVKEKCKMCCGQEVKKIRQTEENPNKKKDVKARTQKR